MIDNRTQNKNYPLVHPENIASQDVERIAVAIEMIDSDIFSCEENAKNISENLGEIQAKVIKIPDILDNFDTELKDISPGRYITINANGDGFTTVEGGGGSGGNTGEVLIKNSDKNFDSVWTDSRSLIKRSMKVSEVSSDYSIGNSDSVILSSENESQISNEPRLELSTRQSVDDVRFDSNLSIILNNSIENDSGVSSNIASKTEFGRVVIGSGINVKNGVISVPEKPLATTESAGVVKIGDNINVENGIISLDEPHLANENTAGVVKLSNDFTLGSNNELLFTGSLNVEPPLYGFSKIIIIENNVISVHENCARYRSFIEKDTEFSFDFSGFEATGDMSFDLEIVASRHCLISFTDIDIKWTLPCAAVDKGTTIIRFEKKIGIVAITATLKERQVQNMTRLTYDAGTSVGQDFRITTNGAANWIHDIFGVSNGNDRFMTSRDGIGILTVEFTKSAFVSKIDYRLNAVFEYLRLEGSNDGKTWVQLLQLENLPNNYNAAAESELLIKGCFRFYRFILPTGKNLRMLGLHGFYADDYERAFERVSPIMSSDSNGGVTLSYTYRSEGQACNITGEALGSYFHCNKKEEDGTAFIQYAFLNPVLVNFIEVGSRSAYQGEAPSHWKIVASNDGESWVTLLERADTVGANAGANQLFYLDNNTAYKIYRFVSVVDIGYFSLSRFKLYYVRNYTEIGAPYGLDTHVPILTSASDNCYVVTASSENVDSERYAWYAFDGMSGDRRWATEEGKNKDCWISLQFPSATICNAVSIMTRNDSYYTQAPAFFCIQASNDGENWDVLATKTAEWKQGEQKVFEFYNNTAYLHYRLFILANQLNDSSFTGLVELNWGQVLRTPRRLLDGATNLVPVMTGAEQDGYIAMASSIHDSSHVAWHAFDGNNSTKWATPSNGMPGAYIGMQFPAAVVCDQVLIRSRQESVDSVQAPLSFIVQGSNDGDVWIDIYSCAGQEAWKSSEERTYSFDNETAYLYYRVYITLVASSSNAAGVSEIKFLKRYHIEEY